MGKWGTLSADGFHLSRLGGVLLFGLLMVSLMRVE